MFAMDSALNKGDRTRHSAKGDRRKEVLQGVLAVCTVIVGITHFLRPEQYARIVPPPFPPLASVYVSGFFEILG